MSDRRSDPGAIVDRAIESLRTIPPANGAAVSRIVEAAARARAQDVAPNEDDLLPLSVAEPSRWPARATFAAAAIIAIAIVGLEAWRATRAGVVTHPTVAAVAPALAPAAVVAAPSDIADAAPILTQFVFDGRAHRVTLVGDFNNWDERATPLEREPGSALWSVTVPISRGRHIYAFMVDSVWTIDKRAPVARDPDFGVTGSVILVGRP